MKKLQYECGNCGYTIQAPEGRRGCPKCNTVLIIKGTAKKEEREETKPLANKRFIKRSKKKK